MKNIFKPYSLLMHLLAILVFFVFGIIYANLIEAGKGQMLAGGAIVLGYGVMGSFIGFCISVFVAYKSSRKAIFNTNIVLALLLIALWGYFALKYRAKQKTKQEQEKPRIEQPKKQTAPAVAIDSVRDTAFLLISKSKNMPFMGQVEKSMGLGMFSPKFDTESVLYFYGNPTTEKSIREHTPYDSITFKKSEHGDYEITTAPPWLVPDHLKLDYGMLYFKVQSVTQEFIEIIVNTTTDQTTYVNRYQGSLDYWPEFLLRVHSVEFPNPENHKIYVKPLDNAGLVSTVYSFMKPLRITEDWMYVELQSDGFEVLGKGWIRWKKDGRLLIRYSLLS